MKKYLIDTNIAIYYMKGKFDLNKKFDKVSSDNCFISEITLAELKFGVENSEKPDKNRKALEYFLTGQECFQSFTPLIYMQKKKPA